MKDIAAALQGALSFYIDPGVSHYVLNPWLPSLAPIGAVKDIAISFLFQGYRASRSTLATFHRSYQSG